MAYGGKKKGNSRGEPESETREQKKARISDRKLLEKIRKRARLMMDADAGQKVREREDVAFQIPENQWTELAKKERMGGEGSPARPMVSISLVKQPMQLVRNQAQKSRLGVTLSPVGENADPEMAEAAQDLYRRIERDGGADVARMWAFYRAVLCGRGYYRIISKYDEDADPKGPGAWDQEIGYKRFLYQENVYFDPASEEPDGSDAKDVLVLAWYTEDDFEREFPQSKLVNGEGGASLEGLSETEPDWVRSGDDRPLLVAEYWYKDIKREEIVDPTDPERKRYREETTVHCCKVSAGDEILARYEEDGRHIPIIRVLGEELIPVDGERICVGMVRDARDAQRGYNHSISRAVEDYSRLGNVSHIAAAEAIENYETEWNDSNRKNYAVLKFNSRDSQDRELPVPTLHQVDGTKMQLALQMAENFKGQVQSATAVFEPSLGELPKRRDAQSGRAIQALQGQSDAGTSHYLYNLTMAMKQEARVVLGWLPFKYDRPGRVTQVLGGEGEGETRSIMLGQPFISDPKTGRPRKALPNEPGAKTYDFRNARYAISTSIEKGHQTRREAGEAFMAEVVSAYPQLMEFAGDVVFNFRDEPGAKEISKRFKKIIAGKFPNLFDENSQSAPEVAQAKVQALEQQVQQMGQQLQLAMKAIETEQVKQQAALQAEQLKQSAALEKTRLEIDSKERIAAANNETKLMVEGIVARFEAMQAVLDRLADRDARYEEMGNAAAQAAMGDPPEPPTGAGGEA